LFAENVKALSCRELIVVSEYSKEGNRT